MSRKVLLLGVLLLCGPPILSAQEAVSIAGTVRMLSTRDGIPEVAITLCRDTGREVVSVSDASDLLPARDQIQEIRITNVPQGAPNRISIVSASPECANPRQATTDRQGRFAFDGLAAGPYKLHARRMGFVGETLRGANPQVVTQTVSLAPGRTVTDVSLLMIKGGAITGTIRDINGNPMPSITVHAVAKTSAAPGPPLASAQADDRGQYRLFGLAPGEFQVVVRPVVPLARQILDSPVDTLATSVRPPAATPSHAITYHPSVTDKAEARIIELREGEEVTGIDILVRPNPQ